MNRKEIYRGGVIPYYYRDNELLMLFMKPSDPKYGGSLFQIAKGKQEPGETLLQTAFREGQEELGLFRGNVVRTTTLGTFLGRTELFVAEIKDPDMFGDYTDETEETRWMTPEQFYNEGRDIHKPVVKAAVRLIEKITNKQ